MWLWLVCLVGTTTYVLVPGSAFHLNSRAGYVRGIGVLPVSPLSSTRTDDNAPEKSDSDDLIYYPPPLDMDGGISDEEALQKLFLRQLSDTNAIPDSEGLFDGDDGNYSGEDDDTDVSRFYKLGSLIGTKSLVEEANEILPGCPLEIAYKGRIAFGNYLGMNTKESKKTKKKREEAIAKGTLAEFETAEKAKINKSLLVQLSTGEEVVIDVGQIVSSWDVIADEEEPLTPEGWAEVASDALKILSNMSPRKSDLQEFWSMLSQRSSVVPVDSLDLGVYIYQERRFSNWINPYLPAEESNVRALSAAQRYAAALLLHYDDFHFKRRLSELSSDPELFMEAESDDSVFVVEGGYRCLDEGMTLFREGEVFQKYYDASRALQHADRASKEAPFRAGCITRQLRALEMYSMAPAKMNPPSSVKHILKKLNKRMSPTGAREVILDLGKAPGSANESKTSAKAVSSRGGTVVTPWSPEVLSDTEALHDLVQARKKMVADTPPGKPGKRGPSGRMDFRGAQEAHPPICIDGSKAVFLDDAFSLNPSTGELLVHIVDVADTIRKFPALERTARERLSSIFLPSGPVHMMPPQALETLKLSTEHANEVITAAISIDEENGDLLGYRIFASTIGPVHAVEMSAADDIIDSALERGAEGEDPLDMNIVGYAPAVTADLVRAQQLVSKVIERHPWVDASFDKSRYRRFNLDKRSGEYRQSELDKSSYGVRMLNAMLTLYSNATCSFCQSRDVNVPIAWENRDRARSSQVRRFATQPLRNWLAQLQQKQVRAALKLEVAAPRKECALAVAHVNTNKKQTTSMLAAGRAEMMYELLESHCASAMMRADNSGAGDAIARRENEAVVAAVGTGRGSQVKLVDFDVTAQLIHLSDEAGRGALERGEKADVRVVKVDPQAKHCLVVRV
jgi:hypothetical protein